MTNITKPTQEQNNDKARRPGSTLLGLLFGVALVALGIYRLLGHEIPWALQKRAIEGGVCLIAGMVLALWAASDMRGLKGPVSGWWRLGKESITLTLTVLGGVIAVLTLVESIAKPK